MQKYVEVDEPEPDEAPLLAPEAAAPVISQDDQASDTAIDRMTEEELLRGLENLASSEASNAGQRNR
jgi:DNA-directed RNA polymerase subunit omega